MADDIEEIEPGDPVGSGGDNGVPIDAWIVAPLLATARSNAVLAETIIDYVQRMAYVDPANPSSGPRVLKFEVERRYKKPTGDGFGTEQLTIEAPVLALLPVPALLVDEVQIDFSTTVSRAVSQKKSAKAGAKAGVEAGGVKLTGSLSVQSDQTRKSDYRATYSFRLHASQQPATEGMNMLTDIMASIMQPTPKDE